MTIHRARNLRDAAERCQVSPATLSRRITALERDLKSDVFVRDSRGYTLTDYGRQVLAIVERMDAAAADIGYLEQTGNTIVRLAAGPWMSHFLASHADAIHDPGDHFSLDWQSGTPKADIARRHVHIGIRNARPEEDRLAGRRLVRVAFAVYQRRGISTSSTHRWILPSGTQTPSSRWALAHAEVKATYVSTATLMLPLLHVGQGCAVLPCFVGDTDEKLERRGNIIDELTHEQWLVTHHADRHLSAVRQVLDRLTALITRHDMLFAGACQGVPEEAG